jgi:hypothetical protein
MKTRIIYFALATLLLLTACNDNNIYSDLLKAERKSIEKFILDQGITVVTEEPTEWTENLYWKVPDTDNFYFHLVSRGDTTRPEVETNNNILLRFKRYTLEEYADTVYFWTTTDSPDPIKFKYHPTLVTSENTCLGWQLAVKYMKYPKAECKIICPSKMGFSEENSTVTPYGYDLKITNIK